jgi:hypothetical protein
MPKRRSVQGASLTWFLFFCKRLPSAPFPFGRVNPKAARSLVTITVRFARPLYQTMVTVLVAYAVMFLPRALISLRAALAQAPVALEEVARSHGHSPAQARSPWAADSPTAVLFIHQTVGGKAGPPSAHGHGGLGGAARLPAVNHQCRTKVALTRRLSIDLILVIRPATAWDLGRLRAKRKAPNTGFQVATGIKPSLGGTIWPSSHSKTRTRVRFRAAAR